MRKENDESRGLAAISSELRIGNVISNVFMTAHKRLVISVTFLSIHRPVLTNTLPFELSQDLWKQIVATPRVTFYMFK